MPVHPDTHLDHTFLNDAFDFPQYSTHKIRSAKPTTDQPRYRVRGRPLFGRRRSNVPTRRSRNVSEPQLVVSTGANYTRDSWLTDFPTARTIDDIASFLSIEGEITASIQSTASVYDTSVCSFGNDGLEGIPLTSRKDSCNGFGSAEIGDCKSEDSLYSMDSADQDSHRLLLSMPIIPLIKLDRKATVRKPDPARLSNSTQYKTLLSPRISDLRTPARMSSRRYGRILSGPSAPTAFSDVLQARSHGTLTFRAPQQAYQRSVSEPTLSFQSLDDEDEPISKKGIDDSHSSDLLFSIIDGVGTSTPPHNNDTKSDIGEALVPESIPPKHAKRSHQRSSLNHSISLSGILHAVADGCASLDHLLRRPKTKCSESKRVKLERTPNPNDPTSKWVPKERQIFIKVFVPSTDDIWMFRVPQDVTLIHFTSRVVTKLGFVVSFSGSIWDEPKYYFKTDEQFKSWVKGRIRFGRNLPIVAHVLAPLPLVRYSVDAEGCEVWCYA